jgi:hypothetical protein
MHRVKIYQFIQSFSSIWTIAQWFRLKKKVAKIQKNLNFDIRIFNLFFKTSALEVSENLLG